MATGLSCLVVLGVAGVFPVPASATSTGLEVSIDGNTVIVTGHPSAPGASQSQLSGDIIIKTEASGFVVYVDPESGGGAQLWTRDGACTPNDGVDVTEIRCVIANFKDPDVRVNLRGIDERGSERTFAVVGRATYYFLGSPFGDYFQAGDGPGLAEGGAGADYLFGGAASDYLEGGAGPDTIDAEDGKASTVSDFIDCNDMASRGTNNESPPMNAAEYDKGVDSVVDCGTLLSPIPLTRPTIDSDPLIGIEVAGKNGQWDGKGLRFSYSWESCLKDEWGTFGCEVRVRESSNASAMKYLPKDVDEGRVLVFKVTAANNAGTWSSESQPSVPVGKPSGPLPPWTNPYFLDTNPIEGKPLLIDPGGWIPGKGITYSWILEFCNYRLSGALRCRELERGDLGSTLKMIRYTPSDDDIGTSLRITVTASKKVGTTTLTRSAVSLLTGVVDRMGSVEIPTTWQPRSKGNGYVFTKVSEAEKWAAIANKTVPVELNIVRIGIGTIKGSREYRDLLDEAQYLPMNDGAILRAIPDFGRTIRGYQGMLPTVVTVLIYDKVLDLDPCSGAFTSKDVLAKVKGQPLFFTTDWLREEKCTNWRVEWTTNESKDVFSRVEDIRLVQSTTAGAPKTTIVISASRPKLGAMALDLGTASFQNVRAFPEHLSLTWDGDLKAVPGRMTSFRVFPRLAATGQTILGGKFTAVEVFDVNGFPLMNVKWDFKNSSGSFSENSITISAGFPDEGIVRVLVRVQDATTEWHEAYADIRVVAPARDFLTLDGRCFNRQGMPVSQCAAPITETARDAGEFMKLEIPGLAGNTTPELLRNAFNTSQTADGLSNPSVAVTLANQVFAVDDGTRSSRLSPRSDCAWWNLVCKVVEYFVPRKGRVAVKPIPVPEAPPPKQPVPPTVVEVPLPSVQVGGSQRVTGIIGANGCKQLGADLALGCNGGITGTAGPLSPGVLYNADATALVKATGAGLISDMGGAMTVSGVRVMPVSASVMSQGVGSLTMPAQMFGKTKF